MNIRAKPTADLAAARHPQPLAVNISTAAELIGVHRETVARLCRRGELKHLKIGRAVRVRLLDLESFLRSRAEGAQ